ncbi:4-aminobutyrate transaminase [Lithohypha guttulata]|nr:4-aminobutyrate transaminase [Lithohypha guttulata]
MNDALIDCIYSGDLARDVTILYTELEKIAKTNSEKVMNLRGRGKGTYIAFDTIGAADLMAKMRSHGIILGAYGNSTIRLRPMLIFREEHVNAPEAILGEKTYQ